MNNTQKELVKEQLAERWADGNYPDDIASAEWLAARNGYRKGYDTGYEAGYLQGLKDAKHLPEDTINNPMNNPQGFDEAKSDEYAESIVEIYQHDLHDTVWLHTLLSEAHQSGYKVAQERLFTEHELGVIEGYLEFALNENGRIAEELITPILEKIARIKSTRTAP